MGLSAAASTWVTGMTRRSHALRFVTLERGCRALTHAARVRVNSRISHVLALLFLLLFSVAPTFPAGGFTLSSHSTSRADVEEISRNTFVALMQYQMRRALLSWSRIFSLPFGFVWTRDIATTGLNSTDANQSARARSWSRTCTAIP